MVAVGVDKSSDLRLLGTVDAFDQGDTEPAEVDAPDLHAAAGVVGSNAVDPVDHDPALNFDVKPGQSLDRSGFSRSTSTRMPSALISSRSCSSSKQDTFKTLPERLAALPGVEWTA